MMEMGVGFGWFWLVNLGVLSILDAKLFAVASSEGERKIGPLIWGIIVLAVAGLIVLPEAWGLIQMATFIEAIEYSPVIYILDFLGGALEITVCIFLILGGIARIRRRTPGKAVLKIVLGCCLAGLGLTTFVAQFFLGPGYYY